MNEKLYPLTFKPIYKDKIWGGQKIKNILGKDVGNIPNCGEVWLLSDVEGDETIVENGFLAGNTIREIAEIYMQDLLGDNNFCKYGEQFPILVKIIDANDYLSIQVHPDDDLAQKRHKQQCGKTEMWYVIDAEKDTELISGFNQKINQETYLKHLENKTLKEILNVEKVKKGDVFFIPAGRVHSLGPGIMLAEIQQTSDITYRIYDWDRLGVDGLPRELHTKEALDAIDFKVYDNYKTKFELTQNKSCEIIDSEHFTTNIIDFNQIIEKDFEALDSFVIYLCLENAVEIHYEENNILLKRGECALIPAMMKKIFLIPYQGLKTKLLEVYTR